METALSPSDAIPTEPSSAPEGQPDTPPTDSSAAVAYSKWFIVLSHVAVAILLLVVAAVRFQNPDMRRPFEVDEALTVMYYTWAGLQPNGEPQPIVHIEDFYDLPSPGAGHLLMGTYCSLGRWPEPNNHLLNSLLINFATALGPRSEAAARVPALLGAVVFAAAFYYLCSSVLGWRAAAPLTVVWAWFGPYLVTYGETARGFSWTMALQALLLVLAYRLARKPSSLLLGAVMAALAAITALNVVSLSVDWVLPFYLALFFFPPTPDTPLTADDTRALRRNVLAQALSVGGMGFVFLMSHLPAVFSSARQYGDPFGSVAEFFTLSWRIFDSLFSTPGWKLFALCGVLGLGLLFFTGRQRFLTALVVLTLAVNLAHFALGKKLPHDRVCGYFLPLVLLGAAYLVEAAVRAAGSRSGKLATGAAFAAPTVLLILFSPRPSLENVPLTARLKLAEKVLPTAKQPTYMLLGRSWDFVPALYGPRAWRCVETVSPGMDLQVCLFTKFDDKKGWAVDVSAGKNRGAHWRTLAWETRTHASVPEAWPYDLVRIVGKTYPLSDEAGTPERALVFWYPDVARLGINGQPQRDYVDDCQLKYLTRHGRFQAKLDVYSNLECFIFIAEPQEYHKVAQAVQEGIRRFGGRAVVFVPTPKG